MIKQKIDDAFLKLQMAGAINPIEFEHYVTIGGDVVVSLYGVKENAFLGLFGVNFIIPNHEANAIGWKTYIHHMIDNFENNKIKVIDLKDLFA